MKQIKILGNKKSEVVEAPIPEPSAKEVRVKMMASGLCGSDLNRWRAPSEQVDDWPIKVLGHEPCGIIDAVGEAVQHLKVGDRVVVHHWHGCGFCNYCLRGDTNLCCQKEGYSVNRDGAFADYLIADGKNCFILPENLSFEDGAILACGACTAYGVLKKIPLIKGNWVVVFGAGPVGLSTIALGAAYGLNIIAVGRREKRIQLAREFGAVEVVNIDKDEDIAERILQMVPNGVNAVIETSGEPGPMEQALKVTQIEGFIVYLGARDKSFMFNPTQYLDKEFHIRTSMTLPLRLVPELIDFVSKNEIPLDKMVTHKLPIKDALQAFELAESSKDCGKVCFIWD